MRILPAFCSTFLPPISFSARSSLILRALASSCLPYNVGNETRPSLDAPVVYNLLMFKLSCNVTGTWSIPTSSEFKPRSTSLSIDSFPCYMSDDRMVTSLSKSNIVGEGGRVSFCTCSPASKIPPRFVRFGIQRPLSAVSARPGLSHVVHTNSRRRTVDDETHYSRTIINIHTICYPRSAIVFGCVLLPPYF